jgi:mannose-6-phosphate isomerase-like protein (cupin superfamily)
MVEESFVSNTWEPLNSSPEGVDLRAFVWRERGATSFSTGTATFRGNAELPYHMHECSEVITVLSGTALVAVEGRGYHLGRLDCVHIPAGVTHCVRSAQAGSELLAHWSFGSAEIKRVFTDAWPSFEDRGFGRPGTRDPEHVTRLADAAVYEPAAGASFCDLFVRRFGAVGICGGYGRFTKGFSLPCHTHAYDESITILSGDATCLVRGKRYQLSGVSNAFVPQGQPHRFLNSGENEMEMLWVYAGDEPDRTVVDDRYCSGALIWPESSGT